MAERPDNFVHPESLDLTGDFHEQLDNVLSKVRLSRNEVSGLASLFQDLENVMTMRWPGCAVMPFGSIVTGLGIRGSDADCYVEIPKQFGTKIARKADELIRNHPNIFSQVTCIPLATVPIVKFYHIQTQMHCDVSFKSSNGIRNSKLVAYLYNLDTRLLSLAIMIKYWAVVHGLAGTHMLPKYTLNLMIIFYLQHLKILPPVELLQQSVEPLYVDGWNTAFSVEFMQQTKDITPLFRLLGGFFKFYNEFDFANLIVCPYLGVPVPKAEFTEARVWDNFHLYKKNCKSFCKPFRTGSEFCVQDVFEHSRNCAVAVHTKLGVYLKAHLSHAAACYEKTQTDTCNFLNAILLDRPDVPAPAIPKQVIKHKIVKQNDACDIINIKNKNKGKSSRRFWRTIHGKKIKKKGYRN